MIDGNVRDVEDFGAALDRWTSDIEFDFVWLACKALRGKRIAAIGAFSPAAKLMLQHVAAPEFFSEPEADSRERVLWHSSLTPIRFDAAVLWISSNDPVERIAAAIRACSGLRACLVAGEPNAEQVDSAVTKLLRSCFPGTQSIALASHSKRVGGEVDGMAAQVQAGWHDQSPFNGILSFIGSSIDGNASRTGISTSSIGDTELKRAKAEIAMLRASTSWRLTYPLRVSVNGLRMGLSVMRRVRRTLNERGGMRPTLMAAVRVGRAEGFRGLLTRVRRAAGRGSTAPEVEITYADWLLANDTLDDAARARMTAESDGFQVKPLISILVPIYNVPVDLLQEMVASVQRQIYPNWELCLSDDASTDPRVLPALKQLAASDQRIKIVLRPENGHISQATNSALELATGSYIALLDQDDVLTEHALFMVVRAINAYPDARMLYSDEDKLTPDGKRSTPHFKPDWNVELIRVQNFFSHLGVYETALVREVGGFRIGFEGSQDHDLVLRCADAIGDGRIVHIPHVLYHWRMVEGSTAASGSSKPYTMQAAANAVGEHLARRGIDGTVMTPDSGVGYLRVRYALPAALPKVSIIIPTREGVALLSQCIKSIFARTDYKNFEILIVDNGSVEAATREYLDSLASFPNVRVLRDDAPFNYSALNNRAAAEATGEFVCLMNNDIEVISEDWLREMLSIAAQPDVGIVGARLWYPDDRLQHGGVILGVGGVAGHMHHMLRRYETGYFSRAVLMQDVSAVTAACFLVRKSVYDEVGGLDEQLAVAFNDVDFCIRVREAGYRNVWTPHAELYHHESATRGSDLTPGKRERFEGEVRFMLNRWGNLLESDPAYNPNLSLRGSSHCFAISEAPRVAA